MIPKMTRNLFVGVRVRVYCETSTVCHFFWHEYLTFKGYTCSTTGH